MGLLGGLLLLGGLGFVLLGIVGIVLNLWQWQWDGVGYNVVCVFGGLLAGTLAVTILE